MKYYLVKHLYRTIPYYISPYSCGYQLVDEFGNYSYWKFMYRLDRAKIDTAVFPSYGFEFISTSFEDRWNTYTIPIKLDFNKENPDESVERLKKLLVLK